MITPQAAAEACKALEQKLASFPVEVLQEARHRQEIDAHNAKVDQAKKQKKRIKLLTQAKTGANAAKHGPRQSNQHKSISG